MENICLKAFRRGEEINRFRQGASTLPRPGLLSAMFDDSDPEDMDLEFNAHQPKRSQPGKTSYCIY